MKKARSIFAVVAFKKQLFAFGGYIGQSRFIVDVEHIKVSYDCMWESRNVASIPVVFARKRISSALACKERVLVVGMSSLKPEDVVQFLHTSDTKS